jgi:hypothetical protein
MVIRNYNATRRSRSGVLTEVFENIETVSAGFKSVSKTLIPYARSKHITFTAKSLKPFTRLHVYFDKKLVNIYVTPKSSGAIGTTHSNFSNVATPVAGSTLISDGVGNCEGTFTIPNPRLSGNPRFATGDIEFVVTADPNNKQVGDGSNEIVARETFAEAMYSARGLLDTQQETIISTRNAIVRTTNLDSGSSGDIIGSQIASAPAVGGGGGNDDQDGNTGEGDPLAQTFIVLDTDSAAGVSGAFLTSCDIFFFEKDATYPVTMEIRNVVNGSPGPKILPFARKTLQSGEISTSTDGSTATTFTFDSPVYVQGGTEYSICLLTTTTAAKVWIADLGTRDTAGNEITDQPHVGVLFKSANNSVWVPSSTQDMKFSLKRAKFDISAAGLVTLQNKTLPVKTLRRNPIEMTDGDQTLKINHTGHGMYSTANNVTIDGVKSGATTTLAASMSSTATAITLTSGTNFDDTDGKYSEDASGTYYIKIDDEIISYTTISGTGITSATRGTNSTTAASHANGATVELYQIHRVPLWRINKTHTAIANIQTNSYTIEIADITPVVDGATALVAGAISNTTALVVDGNSGIIEEGMSVSGTGVDSGITVVTVTDQNNLVLSAAESLSNNVVLTFVKGATSTFGGGSVSATENAQYDVSTTNIGTLAVARTKINAGFLATSGTSPSGSESSFSKSVVNRILPLNDNYYWESTKLVASGINETNEMAGAKSLSVPMTLSSELDALSPVIDTQRMSMYAVANQINSIDSSSDVYPTSIYRAMTEPEGDNHSAVYLTKKINLETPATSLRVLLDIVRQPDTNVKILFKTLRVDDAFDFDEMSFKFFNDDGTVSGSGGPDATTRPSESRSEYIEHEYTAGVTDDGIGSPLEEFISFQIKIVMRSTNQALPPLLKNLRVLALAT